MAFLGKVILADGRCNVIVITICYDNSIGIEEYYSIEIGYAIMTSTTPRNTLNLRIKPEERDLIDMAAKVQGKNRTDFILEAARNAAQEILLDRTILSVSPEAYAKFVALLDAPPQPNERLLKTMQTPAPWDRE